MSGSKRHAWVLCTVLCACGQEAFIVQNRASGPQGQRSIRADGGTVYIDCAEAPDMAGCPCATQYAQRSCYPADALAPTRNVGVCHDGVQTCQLIGHEWVFGACLGAQTPEAELCSDGLDHNCDGRPACQDPTCAVNPACFR